MSKQRFLTRYLLLVNRLEQGPATFGELKEILERASGIRDKNLSVSLRTLQRDIRDIYDHFGIEIINERKGERRYYLRESDTVRAREDRLLEAYRTVSIIETSQEYASLVFPESRKATGLQHFHRLLHAAKKKRIVEFLYRKYESDDAAVRCVAPVALKEAQHRWYLVGIDRKDESAKTFGLDRISELEVTNEKFKAQGMHVAALFDDFFGVLADRQKKQRVKLSFNAAQGKYVQGFPLHHSQKLLSETGDEIIFEVELVPTYDFIQELLSYGSDLEVIQPVSLRSTIRDILRETLSYYMK